MRKLTPWTLLRRRLEPLCKVLHEAAPWRIAAPLTMEDWVRRQTWEDMWWGDEFCRWQLCAEPPQLAGVLCDLMAASEEEGEASRMKELITTQVMHRMIFAMDLSRKMPTAWRKEFSLSGDFVSDSRMILIDAWRTNAVLAWAKQCGQIYVGEASDWFG